MPDLENDLRATAEDIAADAARLARIEQEKSGLDGDDPRMAELSAKSEELARRIVPKAAAEREIADQLQSDGSGA